MERFPGDSIYDDLPVVLVDVLPSASIHQHNLEKWRDKFAPMFEGRLRKGVVEKLMTDFWWNRITRVLFTENGNIATKTRRE